MTIDWQAIEIMHSDVKALPESLRRLAADMKLVAGSVLAHVGSRPKFMYFVCQGELRLRRISVNGTEVVLQRCTSGFVAEASLESSAYHCDVAVIENSQVLTFPIQAFRAILREDVVFCQFWMARLAREVRTLRAQCERLALRTASERVQHYIESEGRNGRLALRQTRKAWAAQLGLTHEALYRTLATLVADQVITLTQGQNQLIITAIGAKRR